MLHHQRRRFAYVLLLSLVAAFELDETAEAPPSPSSSSSSSSGICPRLKACAAQLSTYPDLEIRQLESSGEDPATGGGGGGGDASGMFPLYDELMDPLHPLDFTAAPLVSSYSLCSCADNQTCGADDSHRIRVDSTLTLQFCKPVANLFGPHRCIGRRGFLRVIGAPDVMGDQLSSVSDTLVFCACKDDGYRREAVEHWSGHEFAFLYQCS